ncbi:MAG: relaxase MobL, partial [Clostridium sp.]|nr:relaxase MobL [Clostridium sp.]
MHQKFVSKIRCEPPNKSGTAKWNRNYLHYIATRIGVDLSLLNPNIGADNTTYLHYIDERPGSHGLFGNGNEEHRDIDELSKEMYKISKSQNIYRAVFSLTEMDAKELGYTTKQKWSEFLNANMADVAEKFKIPVNELRWCAAFHNEPGHPHVHCMFWSSKNKVQNSYIHSSRQTAVREMLSGRIFEDERKILVAQKEAFKSIALEAGRYITNNKTKNFENKQALDIPAEQLSKISEDILNLVPKLPGQGRISYGFMPKETKEEIDKIVDTIINAHPDITSAFDNYMRSGAGISQTYSPSKKHHETNIKKVKEEIYKDLGNIILKSLKSYIQDSELYYSAINAMAERKIEDNSPPYPDPQTRIDYNYDRDVEYELGKRTDIDIEKAADYFNQAVSLSDNSY